MGGGGKGDKQESQITLPPEIAALAKRNLEAAEQAGKIGYVPYQGPTVAALNPMQANSMQQNANAMKAFGMQPANVAATIPKARTYAGGIQGYDPLALYTSAVKKIAPVQAKQIVSPTFSNVASAGAGGVPSVKASKAVRNVAKESGGGGSSGSYGGIPATMLAAAARGKTASGAPLRSGQIYRSRHGGRFRYVNGKFQRA